MQRIVIIGSAHPLRGGLSTFNQRLAKEFISCGHDCSIYSFILQYPSIFFPGKTQYTDDPPPQGLKILRAINSVNPLNWLQIGNKLAKECPDIVVVRYWIPFMGPALGTILRLVKKNGYTKIICIADNVIPHEHRPGDRTFTRYFLKSCHAFITMSEKVSTDLAQFKTQQPIKRVQHPLYDNFGDIIPKEEARKHLQLPVDDKIILFFGFIRHYKGLDILLHAMADPRIKNAGIKLLVAGEFYEEENAFLKIIKEKGISDSVLLKTSFIPDHDVKYFLSAADVVVQPYRNATQSGVTPLAYHFEKPMIVTNVGGLPELVPHEKAGLVTQPEPAFIADAIVRFYQLGERYFIPHLRREKEKYSWRNVVDVVLDLAANVKRKM